MLDTLIHVSAYFPAKLDTIIYGYNYLNQRVWRLTRYWYLGSCSEPGGGGEDSFDPGGGEEMDDGGGGGGDPMNCPHEGADLTFYVCSGDEVVAEYDIVDSLKNQYVFANGAMAIQLMRIGLAKDTSYIHHDYLGNARLNTSRTGSTNSLEYFDIWGESRQLSGAVYHNYRFIGRERDVPAWEDHHYLRNRFYNPSIGRFLTPDPITSGINTYAYCNQNPVMYNDRSGLWGSLAILGRIIYEYKLLKYTEKHPVMILDTDPAPPPAPDIPMNEYGDVFGGGPSGGMGGSGGGADGGNSGGGGRRRMTNEEKEVVKEESRHIDKLEWIWKVREGGEWDWKEKYLGDEDGNYLYGYTGAMQGFSEETLLRAAGAVGWGQQQYDSENHPWSERWNFPWGGAPYGDDPRDQNQIREGFRDAVEFRNAVNAGLYGPDRDATRVRY